MPTLSEIYVHPIKGLDAAERSAVEVSDIGGLEDDRSYAMVDADGEFVNGKREPQIHQIRADYDLSAGTVDVRDGDAGGRQTFHLDDDRAALEEWLSEYFGYRVELRRADGGRYTDGSVYGEGLRPGPTLISRASLETAASWFEGIDWREMRRRLRPNLVVSGVDAFWEDRLLADGGRRFAVGDLDLVALDPVPRCVVPARDPDTGEEYPDFRETFARERERTFPEWAPADAFDHFFALMISAGIPDGQTATLSVGDELVVESDLRV